MARRLKIIQNEMTIEGSFVEFINYCKVKSLKEITIEGYKRNYGYFKSYIGDTTQPVEVLTNAVLREYISYLKDNTERSNVSINTTVRSIRTWLNYCSQQGYLPRINIPYLKDDSNEKNIYTEDELRRLLKKPDVKRCSFSEFRNWVIINMLVSTGIRRHSLTNIKIEDVLFENGLIRLTVTKARKCHYINMSTRLSQVLKEYLKYRGGSQEDYLFVTEVGTQLQDDNLTNAIYRYNKSRNVNKTSIHLFRHTYATNFMEDNGDIFTLSKHLQHSNLAITQNYLRSLDRAKVAKNNTYDPLVNLVKENKRIKLGVK